MTPACGAGHRSSARTTPSSSTGPAAATATTTRPGSSTRRWATSSASARRPSPTRASGPRERERRDLPLLPPRTRGRPPAQGRRLRGHSGHQPAGGGPHPRRPGAAHRHVPRHRRVPRGRVEADARLHRGDGRGAPPGGLQGVVQRRPGRRADGLPPALAPARRPVDEPPHACPCTRRSGGRRVTLIDRIEDELHEAMRERDEPRRDTLRLILSSLRGAEKELQRPLSEQEELQVLQRERKRRVEAYEAFAAAGRDEQAAKEEAELEVLEAYMPEPLEEDELEEIIDNVIA